MGWPVVLLTCPGQGLGGQADYLSQAPRAVEYWILGSELTAEDVASCWSTKPEALTLKHKRYYGLCVMLCRSAFVSVSIQECGHFAFLY